MREDAAALGRFIEESPHGDAMEELPKAMSGLRITRWTSSGSAVPRAWSGALTRAEARSRS